MKKRLFYEAPETELFVVRFEENILSGGGTSGAGNQSTLDFNHESGTVGDPTLNEIDGFE